MPKDLLRNLYNPNHDKISIINFKTKSHSFYFNVPILFLSKIKKFLRINFILRNESMSMDVNMLFNKDFLLQSCKVHDETEDSLENIHMFQ